MVLPCPRLSIVYRAMVFGVAVLCDVTVASANGPTIGRDVGGIFPLTSSEIQLVSESVRATLNQGLEVPTVCVYHLRNLSDKNIVVEMSFLIGPTGIEGESSIPAEMQYRGSEVVVESRGERLHIEWERAKSGAWVGYFDTPPEILPVWSLSFAPREEREVKISYRAMWSDTSNDGVLSMYFRYLAKAASLWADSITSATIVFDFGYPLGAVLGTALKATDCGLKVILIPGDYFFDGREVRWVRKNWEPREDFEIAVQWE